MNNKTQLATCISLLYTRVATPTHSFIITNIGLAAAGPAGPALTSMHTAVKAGYTTDHQKEV